MAGSSQPSAPDNVSRQFVWISCHFQFDVTWETKLLVLTAIWTQHLNPRGRGFIKDASSQCKTHTKQHPKLWLINLLSPKLSALLLESHHGNTTLVPAPGFPSFSVIPVPLAQSEFPISSRPAPCIQHSCSLTARCGAQPQRHSFSFTRTKELHQQLTSFWLYLFSKSFYLHTWSTEKCSLLLEKAGRVSSLPMDATEEPGLSFSLGIPPDHTGHKNLSRKPSCYTQTPNYLSTPRTYPAQLHK